MGSRSNGKHQVSHQLGSSVRFFVVDRQGSTSAAPVSEKRTKGFAVAAAKTPALPESRSRARMSATRSSFGGRDATSDASPTQGSKSSAGLKRHWRLSWISPVMSPADVPWLNVVSPAWSACQPPVTLGRSFNTAASPTSNWPM